LLVIGVCTNAFVVVPAWVQVRTAPEITLTRLDCGYP
jgi:hypothetical protein